MSEETRLVINLLGFFLTLIWFYFVFRFSFVVDIMIKYMCAADIAWFNYTLTTNLDPKKFINPSKLHGAMWSYTRQLLSFWVWNPEKMVSDRYHFEFVRKWKNYND